MEDRSLEPNWQGDFDNKPMAEMQRRSRSSSKRLCNLGLLADHCRLTELDDAMRLQAYLQSGHSPGKRSNLASPFDLDQSQISKRSCQLRLGGHCLTEALDKAARQYHFLRSSDSPGRKRRSLKQHPSVLLQRTLKRNTIGNKNQDR